MRIAILIEDVSRRGGQERVIAELAPRLAREHEVHLYCLTAEDVDEDLIRVHRLRAPFRATMARALWFTVVAGRRARRDGHEVLLSQGGNALCQNAVLCHTCQALRATQWRAHWEIQKPTAAERLIRGTWNWIVVGLERRAVRRCRGQVAAVSGELGRLLAEHHGVEETDIVVAPNGVDHQVFHRGTRRQFRAVTRQRLGLSEQDFVVLFVGGQWLAKGVTHLVDGLAWLEDKHAHLVVVGADEEEFFRHHARKRRVQKQVHFAGATDRPQEYYGAADCLALPTGAEGFSLVAVEGAACGLPVLMTRVGVAHELIEEGVTGFLIERDGRDIAWKLKVLAGDRELREQMGRAAARAARRFSWEEQARVLETMLRRAADLGARRDRPGRGTDDGAAASPAEGTEA